MTRFVRFGYPLSSYAALLVLLIGVGTGFTSEVASKSPFLAMDPSTTGIDFQHFSGQSSAKELIEIMGSGVAMLDYDNDGDLDLYFVNGATVSTLIKEKRSQQNRLYRNEGSFRFSDVTANAGIAGSTYGMGVACSDYDNDGDTDLYLTQFGSNILYRNNSDGTFSDVTDKAGVGASGWSTSAAFVDVDRDGNLDLYVSRYVDYRVGAGPYCGDRKQGQASYCLPDLFPATTDLLYTNQGDSTFRDVSAASGIASVKGNGLGVTTADFDGDGWSEIFVANDRTPNFLFHNKGKGLFEEIAVPSGLGYSADGVARAGMGVDAGDFDGDLLTDIAVSNFEGEGLALFRNLGKLFFQDVAGAQRLHEATYPYVGFGLGWIDFDNDGHLDLFSVNGHVLDDIAKYKPYIGFEQPPLLFRNVAGRLQRVIAAPGDTLHVGQVSRGAAFGDLDNDGRIDIVVQQRDGMPSVLRNVSTNDSGSALLELRGAASNRDAVGARVIVTVGSTRWLFEVKGASSYLSQSDRRIQVGLNQSKQIDRVEIAWPSGERQILTNLRAGQRHRIRETSSTVESLVFATGDR